MTKSTDAEHHMDIIQKELYDYSFQDLENKKLVKRHVEIKSLYLLQATTLLLTLFLALDNKGTSVVLIILKVMFYITITVTILFLLLSLNDKVNTLFGLNKNGFLHDTYNAGKYLDDKIDEWSLKDYRVAFIKANSECIEKLDNLINTKSIFFNISLFGFTLSMFILILMAFINLGGSTTWTI